MYNRYIPEDVSYTPVEEAKFQPEEPSREKEEHRKAHSPPQGSPFRLSSLLSGKEGLAGLFAPKERGGLNQILKGLKLEKLDAGDILLLLIILYLLVEGDDLDLVIALALVLLMGLGEEKGK